MPDKFDHPDDEPLDPKVEVIRQKLVRLLMVSGGIMLLDYYADFQTGNNKASRISSIVADILLEDEVEAARLYSEMEVYLNKRYGLSDGVYGKLSWDAYTIHTNSMEVRLALNDTKKQVSLNFVDLQPAQNN